MSNKQMTIADLALLDHPENGGNNGRRSAVYELSAILGDASCAPACITPSGQICPGDGVNGCKKCHGKVAGRHTMKSVMEAVEASAGYICLTSDQCAALAQALNGAEQ